MKKISLLVAALLAGLASVSAQAVGVGSPVTGTFDVAINLTSACQIDTSPLLTTPILFVYTSLGAGATAGSTFKVSCTNTLPITSISLDGTGIYTDAATNLTYALVLGAVPTAGTGVAQTVNIGGTMAAGQGGTCATASCTNALSGNKTRTLTITY